MRCIIAGSRHGVRRVNVEDAMQACGFADEVTVVVSGGALGADIHGEAWAKRYGREVERFPIREEDWRAHGKFAGPLRNQRMAEASDALVAVWDGESRGTADMIRRAKRRGLRTYVHHVTPPDSALPNADPPEEG